MVVNPLFFSFFLRILAKQVELSSSVESSPKNFEKVETAGRPSILFLLKMIDDERQHLQQPNQDFLF